MNEFITALWELTLEMAPYLLLGFGIAGLLYAFVPKQTYHKYLSRPGFRSVLNATLLGIPLPLCSCGVLPTAVSLRRSGASRGACTSFLISTPQTGVDSILATYSLLGLPFAIVRPLAALVTGVVGGVATDVLFRHEDVASVSSAAGDAAGSGRLGFVARLKKAFAYAFGELLEDVGRWLVIGLLVAAVITVAVPDNFFATLQQWPLLNMLLVLLVAVPMYVCATGSIPIALSLMLKGMTPGAAFVLLMAGPAINAASMLVIDKAFGRKQTAIYLLSIVGGAVCFGLAIDYLLPSAWFVPQAVGDLSACSDCLGGSPAWWKILCGVIFALLLLAALWRRFFGHSSGCGCHSSGCDCHSSGCDCHGQEHSSAVQTLRMKVGGMRCSHCAANVKSALMALPFVGSVDVELATGMVVLAGRPGMEVDKAIICNEIEKAGYSVEN